MIPATIPIDTPSRAEKELFPILRDGLDDSFTVFHSFDLHIRKPDGRRVFGEIDFLILSEKYGILVLEVKSGTISYDGKSGIWKQNQHVLDPGPVKQASSSMYKLKQSLENRLGHSPVIALGYAICFADASNNSKSYPPELPPDLLITHHHLENIQERIVSIMDMFYRRRNIVVPKAEIDKITDILMPYCEYGISLADKIGQEQRIFFSLTDEQCKMLNFVNQHKKALVEGCSGSGKTIMAIKKAKELAQKGNRVLLLSFNILIGQKLAYEVSDLENITAGHYHQFCESTLQMAGKDLPDTKDEDYWDFALPQAFEHLITDQDIKYDAVIIDEGQDFRTEWWITLNDLVKEDGYFYVFYDPDQNLWDRAMDFPISAKPFMLTRNCRNTRSIFTELEKYASHAMELNENAPEGEKVVHYHCTNQQHVRKRLGKILHDLVNQDGVDPKDIVILGGRRLQHTSIGSNNKIGNFAILEEDSNEPNTVSYYTYMKFKGCECPIVILLDVNSWEFWWADPQSLYTAMSRAQNLLYVIWGDWY